MGTQHQHVLFVFLNAFHLKYPTFRDLTETSNLATIEGAMNSNIVSKQYLTNMAVA